MSSLIFKITIIYNALSAIIVVVRGFGFFGIAR